MSQEFFPLSPSLWAATAAPAPETTPLQGDVKADVVVVGAGYCGLSTALHLAERGVRVVVLEARDIGFGGSGRNGGQVIPGMKFDPSELMTMFGREKGQRLVDFAAGTVDAVFNLIDKHKMDVPQVRRGWVQGSHTPAALKMAERRVRDWGAQGVAAQLLDRTETARLLGTDKYLGGWMDPRGGGVQPLSYVRGLARAAIAAGVVIHTDSPATQLLQDKGQWQVTTAGGARVSAERVVLCTNGYTDGLWPQLRKSIINANSFQIATEPLPKRCEKHPARRPCVVGRPQPAALLPHRPQRPPVDGRARNLPGTRLRPARRLVAPAERDRQAVPAGGRHSDCLPLVRACRHHARLPAAPA